MIVVPFGIFCAVLLLFCLALLCVAIGRLLRTPRLHPDRAARVDMVRLLGVASITLGLAVARTQFLSYSNPFLILSVALGLCGMVALGLLVRLIGLYRGQKTLPSDPALPDVKTLQSRITPPSMERNNDDSRRNPES